MSKLPRRISKPLDDDTIAAVEILNEAVKDARVPGVNDFMIVTSALQRVIDERRNTDLLVAGSAFDQLDDKVRADIAERAVDRAEDYRALINRAPGRERPEVPKTDRDRLSPPAAGSGARRERSEIKATKGALLLSAMSGMLRRKE